MSFLDQPHVSIISRGLDAELVCIHDTVEHRVLVDGRGELERVLGELLAVAGPRPTPKTLDLIGHSTSGKSLLLLGDWVIDATNATVASFFRELADQEVMPRLGVRALRLLGCLTAERGQGRWTIGALAEILGIEVYGTTNLIFASHYDARGFVAERERHLVSATELASRELERQPRSTGTPTARMLDIDNLQSRPTLAPSGPWTHRLATAAQMASALRLVRRGEGAAMPGLLSVPACELVFPAAGTAFHRMQVMLDAEFVRVYPDPGGPGILYPVDDVRALATLLAELPELGTQRMPIA